MATQYQLQFVPSVSPTLGSKPLASRADHRHIILKAGRRYSTIEEQAQHGELMSTGDNYQGDEGSRQKPPSRTSSRSSSRRSSTTSTSRNQTQPVGPPTIIEFVDSQDPNVKSAIQRHTAYHSAAQRREARLRSLRRGSQPRVLEWGRRPLSEPPSTTVSGASTVSGSPPRLTDGPTEPLAHAMTMEIMESSMEGPYPFASAPGSRSVSPRVPITDAEDAVIQLCKSPTFSGRISKLTETGLRSICSRHESQQSPSAVIALICTDEASTQIFLAYCYTVSARAQVAPDVSQHQLRLAQYHFGRGTNSLWTRLRDPDPALASSDANIQAVLLLVAYTADFGQANEVGMHAGALRIMVEQRGGVDGVSDPTLRAQLEAIASSRQYHLTLASSEDCGSRPRFPDGFWHGTEQQ
jgi:hypothetical protein